MCLIWAVFDDWAYLTLISLIFHNALNLFSSVLGWTIFNEGAYLTLNSIFNKALNLFTSTVKSHLNPFLEQTSTLQRVVVLFYVTCIMMLKYVIVSGD